MGEIEKEKLKKKYLDKMKLFKLDPDQLITKVGRASTNEFVLVDPYSGQISKVHFEIHKIADNYFIKDCRSKNGTFIKIE